MIGLNSAPENDLSIDNNSTLHHKMNHETPSNSAPENDLSIYNNSTLHHKMHYEKPISPLIEFLSGSISVVKEHVKDERIPVSRIVD